jgi:ABC-type Fe3+/spermidine/putrescine transport system ATPase subunit
MGVGNLWDGVVCGDGMTIQIAGTGVVQLATAASPGSAVFGVRAERIQIGAIAGLNQITGVLERTIYAGEIVTHQVRSGSGTIIQVTEPAHGAATREGEVTLSFPPDAVMVFPR